MGKKPTAEEIEERLEKVEFGLLNGFSCRAIAEKVNVSTRQVERDRKVIRKRNLELFKKTSPEDRLADLDAYLRTIKNMAVKVANSTKKDHDKIAAINALQRNADSEWGRYKDLGYVEVLPQKVELSGQVDVQRIVDIVKGVKARKGKKHAKAKVQVRK